MVTGGRIRIVLFITELALGGTPRRVQALAQRLDRKRFEPYVLSVVPGGAVAEAIRAAGVPVESLEVRNKLHLGAPFRLWSYLHRVRPQILHAFNFHANLLAKVMGKKLARIPVVIASEASVESAKPRLRVAVDRWTAGWADGHYANAEAVRQTLAERERVPLDRIWMVPTGVDTTAFAPRVPDEGRRAALGIVPGERVVVSVGRLDKYKGQEFQVQAVKMATESGLPCRLVLVGAGPLRSTLEAKAAGLGISDRVVFTGPQEDVTPFLALADVFVLSSTEEGLPGSLLEAMSMRTVCLATKTGGVTEVIVHGKTGYLVPPADPDSLAEKLREILEHPGRSGEVRAAARERVEREFSVERMVRDTQSMYEVLAGSRGGTPPGERAA